MVEGFDGLPVGPMSKPHTRLVEERLMELSGHCGLFDTMAAEIPNGAAQAAPAEPFEILANACERGIGEVGGPNACNVVVLAAKCFGHEHGIPAPGCEQA